MQSTEEEPENRDAGVTQSYMSDTSTLRPLQSSKQTSARAARRLSGTSQTSATTNSHGTSRPMIVSPRSSVTSPTRRPYSPPSAAAGQRPVSPPTRARSVMTTRGVASGPHVQQGLMEASAPKAEELAKFVALCRDCYYDKNAAAGRSSRYQVLSINHWDIDLTPLCSASHRRHVGSIVPSAENGLCTSDGWRPISVSQRRREPSS